MSSIPAKDWKSVWELLTSGIRDYVRKNGFTDVVLGLSGGMDSALVAALAVDALGKDHVHGKHYRFRGTGRQSGDGNVHASDFADDGSL